MPARRSSRATPGHVAPSCTQCDGHPPSRCSSSPASSSALPKNQAGCSPVRYLVQAYEPPPLGNGQALPPNPDSSTRITSSSISPLTVCAAGCAAPSAIRSVTSRPATLPVTGPNRSVESPNPPRTKPSLGVQSCCPLPSRKPLTRAGQNIEDHLVANAGRQGHGVQPAVHHGGGDRTSAAGISDHRQLTFREAVGGRDTKTSSSPDATAISASPGAPLTTGSETNPTPPPVQDL